MDTERKVAKHGSRTHDGDVRHVVYRWCMARTNIDIDEDACLKVMERYSLGTKREAVNFALRHLANEALDIKTARALRGSGWSGNLDDLRANRQS